MIETDGNGLETVELGCSTDSLYKVTPEYVAGFFDGEGCIRVLGGKRTNYVGLHVFITNTYKPVLDMLKSKYGGNVTLRTISNEKHRTIYQWRLCNKTDIRNFILSIVDFSIEKKAQLLLGLDYCDLPTFTVNRHSSRYPEVIAIQLKRKEIAEEMSGLKRIDY